jgi:beta-glucosidase
MRELGAYVATLERDHVTPGGWADRLFDAADRGELSPEEARSMVIDYIGPSLDTTILATGFMVHCLATTEGALDAVRDDPSLVPSVVNEVVRLSSPIRGFTRLASEDVELGGWTAPKGARLLILYASANRDERRYESPDAFRVTRNPRDHVGWGHGAHTCVGIHLARLEMEVLLSALVGQVGRIETDEPTRLLNNVLQGFATLPTRFHKHHARGSRPPRRQVLGAVAASLIAPEAARASSRPPKAPGFVWGVAAASAQTESRGGRGRSNWDVFADTPGKIGDGSTNARCTEFETRYPRDLDLLKAGGVGAFRMSIAWPRIQPEGPGQPSAAGLDTYDRIIDAMLARGIDPWVTLFHWDTPIWAGDFRDRDITRRMADYADIVVARLGDRVTHWIMLNEPNSVAFLGYFQGVHAPGLSSLQAGLAAIHHQNLAGGLMARAARSRARPGSRIGTTINVVATRPASPTPEDARAAAALDMFWNGAFLDPLFGKGYPAPVAPRVAPLAQAGDMDVIATPLDFLGVNNYSRIYARATGTAPGFEVGTFPPGLPQTANYPVEPGGLTDALVLVRQRYGAIPIVVTETGFALTNEPDWRAELADDRRIAYVDQYLSAAAAARAQGVDLRGLFYWAATDNWEWAKGFAARYGMIAVDPKTQARAAKRSLSRYGGLVRSHFPDAA